ncbi:MAG: hypothetical protein HOE26_10790, partial [Rhodospirillaceae bacterium]|nr:hypothetical protein [Rhodospirillaceae bacterium]
MKYVSTRGNAPELEFDDVLLAGLARDGGLYVPSEWPTFSADEFRAMKDLSYNETAFRVIRPFIDASMGDDDLAALIEDTYSNFDDNQIAPLKHLGDREYLLELFHGPTLAFKDIALQFLGRMFDHVLHKRDEHITVVGATSGDTGSAAIEACRGRDSIDIFILHPEGRVTDVQRRQMTTVTDANVALGFLDPAGFSGGRDALDVAAADAALDKLAAKLGIDRIAAAEGVFRVVNT